LLSYLRVSDLALIKGVQIEFHEGLNVLSGETGAGKTVLVEAIGLLLGDRADATMVRTGASEAVLEASFDLAKLPEIRKALEEMGFVDGDAEELTMRRSVPADGKSRCAVNGRICPVSALSQIGDLLVEVHGQNTHQALVRQATHVTYLDRFAGQGHLRLLREYRGSFSRFRDLLLERNLLRGRDGIDTSRESELLRHEIEQIDSAKVRAGEVEELESEAARLRHSKELWELADRASGLLSGERASTNVRDLAGDASSDLGKIASRDPSARPLASRLESLSLEAEDVASEIDSYRDALEMDPGSLEEVEARLSMLRELCRRFGGSLSSALEYREQASARLEELDGMEQRRSAVEREIASATEEVDALAGMLAKGRKAAAGKLENAVVDQMAGLGLSGAVFAVAIADREEGAAGDEGTGRFGPDGSQVVEFLFSPLESEPPRPLRKIASGGEMSRVMLALKIVLASADRLPVLIFDEVDAGIGGETASSIGEKLSELTGYHQVFCVTHLAQIASFADWQYAVSKTSAGGEAGTAVDLLLGEERVAEMCRMMGDASGRKVTAAHARDILERAEERKKGVPPRA
jgi:DNA repair protein RecN (Recombination protein N)